MNEKPKEDLLNRLAGKVAVVTGSGRGIGRAYAHAFAAEGASIVVNDLGGELNGTGASRSPADQVVQEIHEKGGKAVASYDDVSSFNSAARIMKAAVDNFGRLDILVTNAGTQRRALIHELTEEDWDTVHTVHVKGTFNCVRHAAPIMMAQKSGVILTVTSGTAWMGNPGIAAYSSAKGAIISFMLVAANELKAHGIRVNCMSGNADTRFARTANAEYGKFQEATGIMRRAPEVPNTPPPENIPPLAVLLASDEGRNITGKAFRVMGDRIEVINPPGPYLSFVKPGGWKSDDVFASFPRTLP